MPCRDSGMPDNEYRAKLLRDKINTLTQMLCGLCHAVENSAPFDGEDTMLFQTVQGLEKWWAEHKAADLARLADENRIRDEKRRLNRLRREALSKLSDGELEALGIPGGIRRTRLKGN